MKNKAIRSSGSYPLHFVTATIKNPELQRIFDSFEWGNYSWIEEQSFLPESNIPSNSATFRTVKNRPRYFGLPTPDNHPPGAHTHTHTYDMAIGNELEVVHGTLLASEPCYRVLRGELQIDK